jgi:hypothetical protein
MWLNRLYDNNVLATLAYLLVLLLGVLVWDDENTQFAQL